ncbi:MAG: hypothetical protein ACQERF_12220 [Actinomycetota bacterium]
MLTRIRAGSYAAAEEWDRLKPAERHVALLMETVVALGDDLLFSHQSGAALLGIPIFGSYPIKANVTCLHKGGGVSTTHVTRHTTKKPPEEVAVGNLRCTSPARTVIDIARTDTFHSGLIAMDHVLRNGLASESQLREELDTIGRARGAHRASLVLERADPLSESPGESLSRARMYQLGAPLPVLQKKFYDAGGHFVGRTDFYWEDEDTVGEFDGLSKYRRGQDSAPEDIVTAEKVREDDIRLLVSKFIRWTWQEAAAVTPLETKLRRSGILKGPPLRLFGLSMR